LPFAFFTTGRDDIKRLKSCDSGVPAESAAGASSKDDCRQLVDAQVNTEQRSNAVHMLTFPERLMELIKDGDSEEDNIYWTSNGDSFRIRTKRFNDDVLRIHFQATKFESFVRKLNRWGFKRVHDENLPSGTIAYKHPMFQKGKPELLKNMSGVKKKENVSQSQLSMLPDNVVPLPRSLTADLQLLQQGNLGSLRADLHLLQQGNFAACIPSTQTGLPMMNNFVAPPPPVQPSFNHLLADHIGTSESQFVNNQLHRLRLESLLGRLLQNQSEGPSFAHANPLFFSGFQNSAETSLLQKIANPAVALQPIDLPMTGQGNQTRGEVNQQLLQVYFQELQNNFHKIN